MSLAAVPAYLLARRVVGQWPALLAALLTVAVPSMVYTATVMTENAYYPVFLLAALVLVLLLERPSAGTLDHVLRRRRARLRDAFAGGRDRRRSRDRSRGPRRFPEGGPAGDAAVRIAGCTGCSRQARFSLVAVQAAAGGRRASSSARTPSSASRTTTSGAPRFVVYHLAELDLYLGIIPVIATVVLTARARSLDAPLQGLARRHDLAARMDGARRRHVRIALRRPHPGAQHVRGGAAVRDPAARLDRPRGAAAAGATPRVQPPPLRLFVLAIPFDRFVTTSAVSDTLMLLPVVGDPAPPAHRVARMARVRRCGGVRRRIPPPASTDRTPAAVDRARLLARRLPADLVRAVPVRRAPGRGRGTVPGHPGRRARLDRSRRARGLGRRRPLDGPQRPVHGQPERVLQPIRGSDLLHRRPDAGWCR